MRIQRFVFYLAGLEPAPPNHALQPTAASALRLLAVPSSLRSSAAAEGGRWAYNSKALAIEDHEKLRSQSSDPNAGRRSRRSRHGCFL